VATRPDVYFVCVPDGEIQAAGAELGAALRTAASQAAASQADAGQAEDSPAEAAYAQSGARPLVVHTSGVTSISALLPCERAGAITLVFHPLQTFPDPIEGASRFAGAGVAITPGHLDPNKARAAAIELADTLEMRPFLLEDDKRPLYHAAATVACNYLVTLEYLANQLFVKAGLPEREALSLFLPLVRATIGNLAARGPVDALTGPLSRGDTTTVAAHIEALASGAPWMLAPYRVLGLATLELVAGRHEVDPGVLATLRDLLAAPAQRPAGELPE
jgi:predicted short-subunit dehydrogenase-like oxidoreductase (DUF2520 family)